MSNCTGHRQTASQSRRDATGANQWSADTRSDHDIEYSPNVKCGHMSLLQSSSTPSSTRPNRFLRFVNSPLLAMRHHIVITQTLAVVSVHPGPRITSPRNSWLSAGSRGLWGLLWVGWRWREHCRTAGTPRSSLNIQRHLLSEPTSITNPNARATHFLYLRKLCITQMAV